jgi:hypothetical protein
MTTPAHTRPAEGAGSPLPGLPRLGRAATALAAVADPEWPLLLAVMLVPAGLALVAGERQKASFFLGTAVYVAALKWLGWAVFGRRTTARPRYLLFPAELFAGLAIACAWFYLRNLVARLWPASYGLGELAWLFPALLVLHVAALLFRARSLIAPGCLAALGERLALYAPFAVVLTAALWSVSAVLGVQGTDAMVYTFQARIYRTEGIDFAVPPTHLAISYPSGFGAINATAAALAPLTVLQAFHLQHVLLCVAALFLVTTTVAALAGRPLPLLHSLPVPFLFLFPLYALHPDVLYPGVPKQAGPPLCAAVCLLPLLAPVGGRTTFFLAASVVGILAVLAAALNPACVPYALVASVVAGAVLLVRGRAHLRLPFWQTAAGLAGIGVVAAGLVFGCDLYYRSLVRGVLGQNADSGPISVPATEPTALPPRFSPLQGARGLASVNPIALSPLETTTDLVWLPAERLMGWDRRWPAQTLPVAALALTLLALAGLVPRQGRAATFRDPLVRLLLAVLVMWLGLKYALTFGIAGLSRVPEHYLAGLLSVYLRYLLLRCEFLLLFALVGTAGARLFLTLERHQANQARRAAIVVAAACWLLPALGLAAGFAVSGFAVIPTTDRFAVTEDDLRLAAWLGDNVPPEKGVVGLAAEPFTAGRDGVEHHMVALGGGHALPLYGRHYNFRFVLGELEGDNGAAYRRHVRDRLDVSWCLENGVRYFYVTPKGLAGRKNPGLERAIADGHLRPVVRFGESVLYEVMP